MARKNAAVKELNQEAAALCEAIKGTHSVCAKTSTSIVVGTFLYTSDDTATVYAPIGNIGITQGFKADLLLKALEGCNTSFTITEEQGALLVRWGKKRAKIPAMDVKNAYVRTLDPLLPTLKVNPQLAVLFNDYLKTVPTKFANTADVWSQLTLLGDDYCMYWTDRRIGLKVQSGTWFPDVLVYTKDLLKVAKYGVPIVGIGGGPASVTFYMQNGACIQLATVSHSAVTYPVGPVKTKIFANLDLTDEMYPVEQEFIDALDYVTKMDAGDTRIFISPQHVGNTPDPQGGTYVELTSYKVTRTLDSKQLLSILDHDIEGFFLPSIALQRYGAVFVNAVAQWVVTGYVNEEVREAPTPPQLSSTSIDDDLPF